MALTDRSLLRRLLARTGMSGLFSLATSAMIVAFALVSSAAVSWLSIRDARENLITQGTVFAERFADQATVALLYASAENAREPVRQALSIPEVRAVGVYDPQGQPLIESAPLGALRPPAIRPPNEAIIERETAREWVFLAPVYAGGDEEDATPFAPAVAPELLGYVRLAESKASLAAIARRVVWSNLTISAAIAVVLGVLAHLLARRITDPVRALAAAMRRAQDGDTGARAAETGPLELRTMETAFNRMMDVLEQREADLRTARDQAMEAARVKAQFAAHVSHELRTPLNGLLGMLQLLEGAGSEEQRRGYLRTALSSGRSLLAVINDILDFSRGEAGKIEIEARTFPLRARLSELTDLLHPIAQAKGISLECRFGPDVPDGVVGDPTRIGQVLTNLIGNAIRFTTRGGVVVHVTRTSGPDERTAIAALRFEVTDTGIGIAPDAQAHIFESFTQASATTGREYGGSGLGLTIARQLVELMGGQIGVTSTPGVGSTFWFTLALPVAGQPGAARPLDGVRILAGLAPDDVDQRELVQRLERLGATVTTHPSGGQVLLEVARAIAESAFTAVLVAPQLNEMPGSDLARYLARLPQRPRPRVFALTGAEVGELPPQGCDAWLRVTASDADLIATFAKPAGVVEPAPSRRPRVLVAEDDAASQMVARGLLETAGCRVTCVGDGQAALEALARERFDLVFLDFNMPVLGGLATAQKLRERGGDVPPLIAMTANTLPDDVARARAAGMDDFLAKPVQLDALNAVLDRWLRSSATAAGALASASGQEAEFDRGVLEQLRAALGARLDGIIATFLADAQVLVDEIEEHAALTAPGHVRELAHRLKGAARNVGAVQIARVADRIEHMARAGSEGLAPALLGELRAALVAARGHLLRQLEPSAEPAHGRAPGPAPCVLVVEDDRSTRMTLRALLEDDGYTVVEAADGREALALVERRRPDLVLMDALLPVQDGFSACRAINQRPPGERVPVLMITSLDDEVSVERAFRAGAVDFIPKPINLGVLRRRVHRLLAAQASERDAQRLAYHDPLTGLVNRSAFRERVERVLEVDGEPQTCAVLYLDLDRFKRVNDTLGHEGGDELLRQAAARLRDALPAEATLARVGSDEFAAAFRVRGPEDAAPVAQRVVRALSSPLRLGEHDLRVSASAGVALYPADATDVDSLVKYAETAATRAKEEGGNAVHFYRARMSAAIRERLELEADLRKALERGELVLFYQPQVELIHNDVAGVEALVRWRHPRRGLVSPAEFIPLAEETGLIGMLGEWVLREACAQAQRWRRAGGPALRMGVNVSARQLAAPEFVEIVAQALRETGLPAGALELEVTESVLVQDREGARRLLGRLRALGVRVAIDDFGTGYSSLGYLKHLPVDTLKIDRTFVAGLPMDAHDVAITTGVLNLARSLKLEVVAEGVETGAQLRFLREYGCTLAQGYLLQAPAPAAAFESWLATRSGERRRGA